MIQKYPVFLPGLVLICAAVFCFSGGHAFGQVSMQRPNVLFIMADDHGGDIMGVAGDPIVLTPNLDALAAEGIRFTRCASQSPVCIPTRATIQTGLYRNVHRVGDVLHVAMDIPNTTYFAEVFGRAGYVTGYGGKWHLNGGAIFGSREECGYVPPGEPRRGYHEWDGYNCAQDHDRPMTFDESVDPPLLMDVEGYDWAPTYYTDIFLDFANRHGETGNPWMYFLSYAIPHQPEEAPAELLDLYPPESFTLSPELIGTISETDETKFRRILQTYYALTTFLDIEIGRALGGLAAQGQAENTLVIYLGDHGQLLGSHYFDILDFGLTDVPVFAFRRKRVPYRQAFHSPLIMRWPGNIPAGQVVDTLVSTVDVPPTILNLAGLPVPWKMQGVSMREWCLGREGPSKDALYLSDPHWEAIWTGDYLYCPDEPYRELFDHQADPFELINLVDIPAFEGVRQALDSQLAALSEAALVYAAVPDLCADGGTIGSQLSSFLDELGLGALSVVVDGLPLEAYAALLEGLACQGDPGSEVLGAVLEHYGFNLTVFDEDDFLDTHAFREFVASFMGTGAEVQEALSLMFANVREEQGLSARYRQVVCDGLEGCPSPDELAANGLVEPLSGSGDLDGDGFTNAEEYANVLDAGGGLAAFVRAALDPARSGTEPLGSVGTCLIATAAYGSPLAGELNAMRSLRDERLLTNAAGRAFVDTYYRLSPALAERVAKSPGLAAVVRGSLEVVLVAVRWVGLLPYLVLAMTTMFFVRIRRRLRRHPLKSEA